MINDSKLVTQVKDEVHMEDRTLAILYNKETRGMTTPITRA
jgi:hypothetical protein